MGTVQSNRPIPLRLVRGIITFFPLSRISTPMTMLDRMRRHRNWLKWSLAIVVVSFVLLYIPSFLNDSNQGAAGNAVVASVDGHDITAARFRRVYQQQMQQYRQSYGANVDERLLKQLGIDHRIVPQMIPDKSA